MGDKTFLVYGFIYHKTVKLLNNILNFDKLKKNIPKKSKMSQYSKILIVLGNRNNAVSCYTATYDEIGKCEY